MYQWRLQYISLTQYTIDSSSPRHSSRQWRRWASRVQRGTIEWVIAAKLDTHLINCWALSRPSDDQLLWESMMKGRGLGWLGRSASAVAIGWGWIHLWLTAKWENRQLKDKHQFQLFWVDCCHIQIPKEPVKMCLVCIHNATQVVLFNNNLTSEITDLA